MSKQLNRLIAVKNLLAHNRISLLGLVLMLSLYEEGGEMPQSAALERGLTKSGPFLSQTVKELSAKDMIHSKTPIMGDHRKRWLVLDEAGLKVVKQYLKS